MSGLLPTWGDAFRRLIGVIGDVGRFRHRMPAETAERLRPVSDAFERGGRGGHAAVSAHHFDGAPGAGHPPATQAASTRPATGRVDAGSVTIHRKTEHDWAKESDLALRSIAEAPSAYRVTYEEAKARSEEVWRDKIKGRTSSFAAVHDGRWVGDISAVRTERAGVQEICAMWIDPEVRGTGVGHQLMQTQIQWLKENNCQRAVLWTLEDNIPMQRLARGHGFTPTGIRDFRSSRSVPAIEMSCDLTT
ncbi:GNAT family N-acetyltransferase [Nocardia sp. NPDC004568]|uniref:GNAT family N-acetyltransferase n=1 Tax=Nocardia sp. NPDC004568 TaxID=3154551 RepID=UPI0033BD5652